MCTKRTIRQVAWLAVVFTVAGYAIWYRLALWPMRTLDRCYLISCEGGICIVQTAREATAYRLPSMSGHALRFPPFALADRVFLYWSDPDAALCITNMESRNVRWLQMPRQLGLCQWNVDRLSADGSYAILNIRNQTARKALVVDLKRNIWRIMPNTCQARIDPCGSGRVALRTTDGTIIVEDIAGKFHKVIAKGLDSAKDFDYDFSSETLYVLERDQSHFQSVSNGNLRKRTRLPWPWIGLSIIWQRDIVEIWIPGHSLLSILKLPVFSAQGEYLGDAGLYLPSFYAEAANSKVKSLICSRFERIR